MGNGKSNEVDKSLPTLDRQIANTKEIGFQSLNKEAVCCTGITGVGTVDVPLKVLPQSSSRLGDLLPGTDWLMGASQRDGYHNFMGAKDDNSKPQSVGNFMSSGSRETLLGGAQEGKEMGSNNNLVDCVVQTDYPEILDGSSLTLGVGGNTEARPRSNFSGRDFVGKKDGAVKTQLNPSKGQSGYKSSFSPDLNIGVVSDDFQAYAAGFSNIEQNTIELSHVKPNFGGLPSIVQNVGNSSNLSTLQIAGKSIAVSAFSGAEQNVNSGSLSEYNAGVSGKTSSNFSLSPWQMSPMPQGHVSHSFDITDDQRFGTAFANMDPSQGFHGPSVISPNIGYISNQSGPPYNQSFHGLSDASPNLVHISNQSRLPTNQRFHDFSGASPLVHNSSQSGLPPNQGFHSFSDVSPMVHGTSQFGVPARVPYQMAPWPSVSSYMTSKYSKVASDQLQKSNMGSIPSFQCGKSVASPALYNRESTSNLQSDQLYACDGSGASKVSISVSFPKNFSVQTAEKLSACDEIAAEGFSNIPAFKNTGVQLGSQVIPFARGSGPATTSNLLAGASLKRKTEHPSTATSQVQIKKRRSVKPTIPSSLHKAHDAQSVVPFSPVVSQAPSVPSLAQSTSVQCVKLTAGPFTPLAHKGPASPLLSKATPVNLPPRRATSIPPSARVYSPPHIIKWQDSELPQLSGHNCSICKRDLSYTPEGPVSQPVIPPPVAVLSCGHCFHDLCLQRITPKDQADNPPCIPCAVCEN